MTIQECRETLGASAEGMTDAEIETMRDDLTRMADVLYEQLKERASKDTEAVHWAAHFQQTGEGE